MAILSPEKQHVLFTFAHLAEDHPWNRCLAHYFEQLYARSGSNKTTKSYSSMLRIFFESSRTPPDQVRREDIYAFMAAKTRWETTPAPATRNLRLTVLTSFYNFAARLGLWNAPNPCAGIRQAKRDHSYHVLDQEELRRLLTVIPDSVLGLRDRSIILFYLWTARRREEIARLTWGDLEHTTVIDPDGSHREGWVYHFRGKGRGRIDDTAELPQPAKDALDQYLIASGRASTIRPEDPLWTRETQGPGRLDANGIQYRLKLYAEWAGLSPDISIHWLRHTAARLRYSAGQDIRSIQNLLRHSSLATTDLYLRSLVSTADPFARTLADRIGHL